MTFKHINLRTSQRSSAIHTSSIIESTNKLTSQIWSSSNTICRAPPSRTRGEVKSHDSSSRSTWGNGNAIWRVIGFKSIDYLSCWTSLTHISKPGHKLSTRNFSTRWSVWIVYRIYNPENCSNKKYSSDNSAHCLPSNPRKKLFHTLRIREYIRTIIVFLF